MEYQLTPEEKKLFRAIDDAAGKLPAGAPLKQYHEIAAKIGSEFGLDRVQSVAFFVRTTLSMFESE